MLVVAITSGSWLHEYGSVLKTGYGVQYGECAHVKTTATGFPVSISQIYIITWKAKDLLILEQTMNCMFVLAQNGSHRLVVG